MMAGCALKRNVTIPPINDSTFVKAASLPPEIVHVTVALGTRFINLRVRLTRCNT